MGDGARGARPQRVARIARTAALAALVLAGASVIWWLDPFERLAFLPERGTPPAPSGIEEVVFPSGDGTRLHGWFFPGSAEGRPARGAILAVHGNAGNVSNHAGFVVFLQDAGFDVLLFDYRGYGRSGGGRLHRRALFADTRAAYEALRARPGVDDSRIGVYGQSLGSSFASHLMADEPGIRAGVLVSAFSSWQAIAASVFGGGRPGRVARVLGRLALRSGLDPEDAVRRLGERPLLLVHGTADRIVPFSHAARLAEVAGPGARLLPVDGADHNTLPYAFPGAQAEIVRFLDGALGAAGDAPAVP